MNRKKLYFIVTIVVAFFVLAPVTALVISKFIQTATTDIASNKTSDAVGQDNSTESSEINYDSVNDSDKIIVIDDLDNLTAKMTDNDRRQVKDMLFYTIKNNVANLSNIGHGKIRDNSVSVSFSDGKYTTKFIVDFPDIRQSYGVKNNSYLDGLEHSYTTTVSCLPAEQLIYGAFNCKDQASEESGR